MMLPVNNSFLRNGGAVLAGVAVSALAAYKITPYVMRWVGLDIPSIEDLFSGSSFRDYCRMVARTSAGAFIGYLSGTFATFCLLKGVAEIRNFNEYAIEQIQGPFFNGLISIRGEKFLKPCQFLPFLAGAIAGYKSLR